MRYPSSVVAIAVLFFASCAAPTCDSEMSDIRAQYGAPEEVNTFTQDTYHMTEWWYWSKGVEYTFEWGGAVGACRMSRYTFEPITAGAKATAEERAKAASSKRLVDRRVVFGRGC